MFYGISKGIAIPALALGLSACSTYIIDGEPVDLGIRYAPPSVAASTAPVNLGPNYLAAFRAARANLRAAGFTIVSANQNSGIIKVESNDPALIDCGTISVGPRDAPRRFSGNAATSMIEVPAGPGQSSFIRRSVAAYTVADISVAAQPSRGGGVLATVSETQTVSLTLTQTTDGSEAFSETISFSNGESGRFSRALICQSSGKTAAAIAGG